MKKLLLSAILVGFLTACSGGGGGSGTATTPDNTKVDLDNSAKGDIGQKPRTANYMVKIVTILSTAFGSTMRRR